MEKAVSIIVIFCKINPIIPGILNLLLSKVGLYNSRLYGFIPWPFSFCFITFFCSSWEWWFTIRAEYDDAVLAIYGSEPSIKNCTSVGSPLRNLVVK